MEMMVTFIEQFGYIAVALLIALENIFPPIPSELILTFTGFFITQSHLNIFITIISATLGSLIGAAILYYFGSFLSYDKLCIFIDKYGKYLHVKQEHIEKAFQAFNRYGLYTVFFMRFVPIIRSFISIPAGMAKMKLFHFLVLTTIGSLIWNSILIYLGYFAQEQYAKIANTFETYLYVFILIVVICFALIVLIKKYKKTKKG